METQHLFRRRFIWFVELRKNHSGMETCCGKLKEQGKAGCVRTIVVWKRNLITLKPPTIYGCVRTIVVWKLTRYPTTWMKLISCVRTIVVWKQYKALSFPFHLHSVA